MNHESTSRGNSPNLSDARVSRLVIDKATLWVVSAEHVIDGSKGG